jgi:hypothetical protein
MERRPGLAREENEGKNTPMHLAVLWDRIDVLRVLLEHDSVFRVCSRVNRTDRPDRTGEVRYRFTGPVRSGTGRIPGER